MIPSHFWNSDRFWGKSATGILEVLRSSFHIYSPICVSSHMRGKFYHDSMTHEKTQNTNQPGLDLCVRTVPSRRRTLPKASMQPTAAFTRSAVPARQSSLHHPTHARRIPICVRPIKEGIIPHGLNRGQCGEHQAKR